MIAYHVSSEPYSPRQIVKLDGQSRFVTAYVNKDAHNQFVEHEFETARPQFAQSRSTALFAYPTLAACMLFWGGEQQRDVPAYQSVPRYYEVDITSPTRVIGHLTTRVSKRMQNSLPYKDIIDEFWNPKHPWNCFEYMCNEFTVINEISPPDIVAATQHRLKVQSDAELALRLWPNK